MTKENSVPLAEHQAVSENKVATAKDPIAKLLHEIAGTTHVVIGYADLLAPSLSNEDARGYLEAITAAITRLHNNARQYFEATPLGVEVESTSLGHQRRLVLHVEDDPAIRTLVKTVLGTAEIDVHGVSNLTDARLFLDSTTPDLLIVDQRLGEENGLELLQLAPEKEASPQLAAIVMSGESSVEIVSEAEALGAMVLEKPVANEQLRAIVRRVLQLGEEIIDEE